MKLNMIILTGQGDTDVMLVNDEIFDWVQSDYPLEEGHGHDPNVPKAVFESMVEAEKGWRPEGQADPNPTVSIGLRSFVNDRALHIGDAAEAQFFDMTEAMRYIRENDIEIVRDWEGYIY